MFLARLISEATVIAMLYNLEPYGSHVPAYGEIAAAVTKASNEDPLFPQHEAGCEATATILIAVAYNASRFHTSLIGMQGQTFGLFQIRPPNEKLNGSLLLMPLTAVFIAVDLIRQSFAACVDKPWPEKLTHFVLQNERADRFLVAKKSMESLILAHELFRKHFPQSVLPTALPAKGETS